MPSASLVSAPVTRRGFATGIASLALAIPAFASAQGLSNRPRIATLDWGSAANILALGIHPLAAPEIERYRRLMVEPDIPADVRELGLRSEPNLELIDALGPDFIIMNPQLAALAPRLAPIGKVILFEPHLLAAGLLHPDHLTHGAEQLEKMAQAIGADQAALAYVDRVNADIAAGTEKLARYDGRPLFIISLVDANRALVFGTNSLFQNVLDRWNIRNGWSGETSIFGHATITLDRLMGAPDARIVNIGAPARMAYALKARIPVLTSLAPIRQGRIRLLPDILFYGGLPCAARFARLAAEALAAPDLLP
ncbi:ABC transporter substrate-binding protein [Radicibacter daui]|uniref:ABC transporter substrate-binding protein n=1 Tax=Radicibacter daui TaxID=3064829 RepID=UPI0040469461